MITRQAWRDAVRASGLPASRRAVLLDMADYWPAATTRPILWRSQADISESTGYSEATIKRAWRDAEAAGLLVCVGRARQHYSPRWAPVLPTSQGGQPDRPEDSESGHADRPEPVDNSARAVTVHARAVTVTGESPKPLQTTTTSAAVDAPPAAVGHALVVVEQLPTTLAAAVGRGALARALGPASAAGWTAEQVAAAARSHSWAGAGPGAVVRWAEDLALDAPPAPKPSRPAGPAPRCTEPGHEHEAASNCRACRSERIAAPRAGTG